MPRTRATAWPASACCSSCPASARRRPRTICGALGRRRRAVRPPKRAAEDWPAFADLFTLLRRGKAGWPAEIEAARAWYEPHLERIHEDAVVRRGDLAQLSRIAAGSPSRQRFLTELTLDPPQATSDLAGPPHRDEDYLILSTIHSAKGQEWGQVFVLNCVDGCIPSDLASGTPAEIEEERRLLYVAMTRARDALHLITPLRFYVHGQAARGDRHVYAARTRFLPAARPRPLRGLRLGAAGSGRSCGRASGAPARPQAPDARHVGLTRPPAEWPGPLPLSRTRVNTSILTRLLGIRVVHAWCMRCASKESPLTLS